MIETDIQSITTQNDFGALVNKYTSLGMSYIDSILHISEEKGLEVETIATLITPDIKFRLRQEAEDLHFLPKTSKLPL